MAFKTLHKALDAITALGDPVRRKLYEAVAAAEEPVSRNDLAKTSGVARPLVAYHLDRLVKGGLLAFRFERQSGRVGPGAGRPAKLYYRPNTPVRVSLPARDIELAAQLLVEAVARGSDPATKAMLDDLARRTGAELAGESGEIDREAAVAEVLRLLAERGYEPKVDANGEIRLRNCVFDELANQQREIVCRMNLNFILGMLDARPDVPLEARFQPEEGCCCVVLGQAQSHEGGQDSA